MNAASSTAGFPARDHIDVRTFVFPEPLDE